jgi:sn-2 palmitoyl-lipid 9-desaturase
VESAVHFDVVPKVDFPHRIEVASDALLQEGEVRYAPVKSLWFSAMCIGALFGAFMYPSVSGFAFFVGSTAFILLFGHSLGSHRKFIHDSFQCPRWIEYFLVYCGTLVGLAGPHGLLRQHELRDYAQRLPQCHSFLRHGAGFWRDAFWQLHCDLRFATEPKLRIEPSRNTRFYRFLESTWMWQQLPIAMALYWIGGAGIVCWGVCARVSACVLGHWLIGYFAHNHGEMNFEVQGAAVQGKNIRWTSLITMGESWHNNHHAFPGSARLGLRRGEWDPGWWVICALQRVGWITAVTLPQHLPSRHELVQVDHHVAQNTPALPHYE